MEQQDFSSKLPDMNDQDKDILELMKEINPQSLYTMGFEDLGDKVFIASRKNNEYARKRISQLKSSLGKKKENELRRKYLLSIENMLEWDEPVPDIAMVSEILANHLIKEGVKPERFKKLVDQLSTSLDASILKFEGKNFPVAIKILVQYQVIGAMEIFSILEKEAQSELDLLEGISRLRSKVSEFSKRFEVEGFTDGSFEQVRELLRKNGPDMGRAKFYPKALKYALDYHESPIALERKALAWIKEDRPKMWSSAKSLSRALGCDPTPEAVDQKLKQKSGVRPEEALSVTLKIRPIVQALANESIVGINPAYQTTVVETPPYLSAIIPSGAAQGFDSLTDHPVQRFYLTTDPKRDPPGGFADLLNLLVHEEYGHCVHFSNTATKFAANSGIVELLPSMHMGTTSEGLAFQRELEFLEFLRGLKRKESGSYTKAESKYAELTEQFGGLEQTCLELEFSTYKHRIIRFLRVVGDVRINSGKQNLLDFLKWAEKTTGIPQRTMYFQIFPAHEGSYPGYATCYAVVGQEIRAIQKPFRNHSDKLVRFNAYACSMGFPARSVYSRRLKEFAKSLYPSKKNKIRRKKISSRKKMKK